jgi:hypothetical protein
MEKAGRVVQRAGLLTVAADVYSVASDESFPRALVMGLLAVLLKTNIQREGGEKRMGIDEDK